MTTGQYGGDYDDTLKVAKYTTNNRLFLAILFSFLAVVGAGSVAWGNLLVAPKRTAMRRVSTGGVRGEAPLTAAQRAEVEGYLRNFDLDDVNIRWVDDTNLNTAYGHDFRLLNIGSDVVPGNVGIGTATANSRVSIRGALAHEIVGHRQAALAGRTQALDVLEEAQASIRAARFAPGLTSTERYVLLRDAIARLRAEGLRVRNVRSGLFINQP